MPLCAPGIHVATIKDVTHNESFYGSSLEVRFEAQDGSTIRSWLPLKTRFVLDRLAVMAGVDLGRKADFSPLVGKQVGIIVVDEAKLDGSTFRKVKDYFRVTDINRIKWEQERATARAT